MMRMFDKQTPLALLGRNACRTEQGDRRDACRTRAIPLALLGLALAACAVLAGCKGPPGPGPAKSTRVLCSVFPVYLFTRAVTAGTGLQVLPLLPARSGCPHDYALMPEDMHKLISADVLVVNGAGLEEFLGEPIRKVNANMKVIQAVEGIEGLLSEKDEHGEKGPAGAHEHEHAGVNPHVFASPKMAARMVRRIAAELGTLYPAHAERMAQNAQAYAAELEKLGDEFVAAVKTLRSRKIVTEHDVFDYLARDCGLEVVAVVEEVPGQEPSAARMLELAKQIRASGAAAIFIEPQYPAKVGRTLAGETNLPAATLDPVASGPEDAGVDYYQATMRANLRTLQAVLGTPPPE